MPIKILLTIVQQRPQVGGPQDLIAISFESYGKMVTVREDQCRTDMLKVFKKFFEDAVKDPVDPATTVGWIERDGKK